MPVVILSTFPSADKAAEIARVLVDERLAACVNIVPAVRSIYRWEGAVQDEAESLAVIKTTEDKEPALLARLRALHPYEVPEMIVLPIARGHAPYLQWLADQVA